MYLTGAEDASEGRAVCRLRVCLERNSMNTYRQTCINKPGYARLLHQHDLPHNKKYKVGSMQMYYIGGITYSG